MRTARRYFKPFVLGFFLVAWQPIWANCAENRELAATEVALLGAPALPNCGILENILSAPTTPFNANERFTVENTASNIPLGAVFNWNFSGANVISGSGKGPYEISFPAPGVYTVSVSYSVSGCTARTVSRQFEINPECEAVTGYSASNVTASKAQIDWTNVAPEQGFLLNYRPQSAHNWLSLSLPSGSSSRVLSGLQPLTTYEFVVRRVCGPGLVSSRQDQIPGTFTTNTDPDNCDPPENVITPSATISSITVGWDAAPAAEKYIVQIRKVGTTPWRYRSPKSFLSRSHTFYNLQANTPYEVWIYGVCPVNQPSANIFITTNTLGGKR